LSKAMSVIRSVTTTGVQSTARSRLRNPKETASCLLQHSPVQ